MPTTAEMPSKNTGIHHSMQSPSYSWTDDLSVCHDSAVGYSPNQIYREDGAMCNKHEFEDRSFHFRPDSETCLYGVFDGHDGTLASYFAAQRLPAELLLGQLHEKSEDKEIKIALHLAIEAVERGFFNSIDDKLAEIANLQIQLPEDIKSFDMYQQYPDVFNNLKVLNAEIAGGTTAVVCLLHQKKLYVSNVGDSRAILVKKDKNTNQIDVLQLSVDHDLKNEDELLRLSHLGLDVDQLRQCSKLGNQDNTRCIGNYQVKGGYKDFEILCAAESEPVIAEPEIIGGIPIDDNCLFLLLMSDGFYKTLETVGSPSQDTNAEIAKVVIEQFSLQSTLAGVAQGAVDKVVRFHHDQYMNSCSLSSKSRNFEDYRDDITLLVRNFNMSLPNMRSVRMGGLTPTGRPDPLSQSLNKNLDSSSADATDNDTERTFSGEDSLTFSSTQNSTNLQETFPSQNLSEALSVDENGHLPAYVDFSEYYKAVAEAEQQGKNVFDDADLVEGWKNDECGVIME